MRVRIVEGDLIVTSYTLTGVVRNKLVVKHTSADGKKLYAYKTYKGKEARRIWNNVYKSA